MADTTAKELARAVRFKEAAEQFLNGLDELQAAREDTVNDGLAFDDAQLTGVVAHLTAADLASLQSTIDAIPGLLTGHLTNLTKVAGR